MSTDLESADPRGNLAVLIYRGLEALAKNMETKHGINGIWSSIQPHANKAIVKHVGDIEIPLEGQILLNILQQNWDKIGKQKL